MPVGRGLADKLKIMKTRYYHSNTSNAYYVVSQEEDGFVNMFTLSGKQLSQHEVGSFINGSGGFEAFIARVFEDERTPEEILGEKIDRAKERDKLKADRRAFNAARLEAEAKRYRDELDDLIKQYDGQPIPATEDNIYIVARALQTENWGSWNLPKMTVGYRASQYDCDGKIAVTFVFDEPIPVYRMRTALGDSATKFAFGAPLGHLEKYYKL